MAQTFRERMAVPDSQTDDEEIWSIMRTWFVLIRWIIFFATILISELFNEYFLFGLSIMIWAIALGIPSFIIISILIIQGDKKLAPELEAKRLATIERGVLKRPIRKRE